jgi:cardiolipin synthase
VPDDPFLQALQNQAMAGVEVIVQIPLKADRRFVYKVTTSFLNELFKYGIKVYLYPGFLHAKMVVVDDSFCSIGTANIDIRSFALNFEVNAFLFGEEIAGSCTRIFLNDLEKCTRLTEEKYKNRGVISKVEEDIYRLLSPLL